jgi:hypothetical protein
MSDNRRIAVIGAGLAGLACARSLHDAGVSVTLIDQAAQPGGRCSTRSTPAGPFDVGTPWLSAASETFNAELQAWADAGLLAPAAGHDGAWLGTPTMQALPQHLAQGLMFAGSVQVAALERDGAHWRVRTHGAVPLGLDLHFDAVVVAMPTEQAVPLLGPDPALAETMRAARSEPCWTVAAAWPVALPVRTEELTGSGDPLACARREDTRPDRPKHTSRWVLQASAYWSANNLDVREPDVIRHLLDAFARAVGVRLARPSYAAAHLWRQAQVPQPLAQPCGWNAELQLGACGDAWHAGEGAQGAERAWLSGRALAAQVLAAAR